MSDTLPSEVREAAFNAAFAVLIDPDSPGPNIPLEIADDLAAVKQCTRMALDAALSALEAAGWVCVPVEPSVAMQEAVARIPIHVGHQHPVHIPTAYVRELLSALLTASNPKEKPDV